MKNHIATIAVLSAFAGACDPQDEAGRERVAIEDIADTEFRVAELPANTKATQDYYEVRRDYRKCIYPLCGGWYLSKVNKNKTNCPVGGLQDECYVPDLMLPEGIDLADDDLVHGTFGTTDINGTTWGNFTADFAYAPTLADPFPWGGHDLVYNTGIVCITSPCPSTALARLNKNLHVENLDYFFLGADADEDAQLEEAFIAEYAADTSAAGAGAITFGEFWLVFGDLYYSVYNVYTLKTADAPVCVVHDLGTETTAWTFPSEAAAQDLLPALEGDVQILEGTCGEQSLYCPAVYQPVHGGIDANGGVCETHGNSCEFRSAVIAAAGDNKAKGSWTEGVCPE